MDDTNNTNPSQGTSTTTNANRKRKQQEALRLLSDEDENSVHFARFFVVKASDSSPIKYNIFAVQKFVQCAIGDVRMAKKLANGTVLIEVASKDQASKAMRMTDWFDTPITVTPHRSLNTCRGVIRCRELRDCEDSDVLAALGNQGVSEVKHIMTKKNDKLEPTNTFILTFKSPTPPKSVKVAYMNVNVELYIPNPLRCYKCQKFGHGKNSCNRATVCCKCGQEGHEDTHCTNPVHCANCSGNHAAFSKDCPIWSKQRDITQIKFEKNISFYEARQIVEKRAHNNSAANGASSTKYPGVSYAKAVSTQTRSIETQTELTWPLDCKLPVSVANVTQRKAKNNCSVQTEKNPTDTQLNKQAAKSNVASTTKKSKPSPAAKAVSNRGRKGANDPVDQFNRYGFLDDDDDGGGEGDADMEYQVTRSKSSSPRKKSK